MCMSTCTHTHTRTYLQPLVLSQLLNFVTLAIAPERNEETEAQERRSDLPKVTQSGSGQDGGQPGLL